MLKMQEIDRIVDGAVEAVLTRTRFSRVFSHPSTDHYGDEVLDVTIVLRDNWPAEVNGERAVNTMMSIRDALQESGEDRFPIIEFATESDLEADDGT